MFCVRDSKGIMVIFVGFFEVYLIIILPSLCKLFCPVLVPGCCWSSGGVFCGLCYHNTQ